LPSPSMQKMKSSPSMPGRPKASLRWKWTIRSPQRSISSGIGSPVITKWLGSKVTWTSTASSTRWAVAASWARVPQQGSRPISTPACPPRSLIRSSPPSAAAQASSSSRSTAPSSQRFGPVSTLTTPIPASAAASIARKAASTADSPPVTRSCWQARAEAGASRSSTWAIVHSTES